METISADRSRGADGHQPVRPSGRYRFQQAPDRVGRLLGAVVFVTGWVFLTSVLTTLLVPGSGPAPRTPMLPTVGPALAAASPVEGSPVKPRSSLPDGPAQSGSGMPMPEVHLRRPGRIHIPALDVNRRLVPLEVLGDGSLAAPRRYSDVGWWKDGPTPGAGGNAVVVGHVDSETGPAVFYGLATLAPGDHIEVTRQDRSSVRFRVRMVKRFPLARFPADRVYRRFGRPGLALITCGGAYDHNAGRYLDNVVVFAGYAADPP